MIKEKGLRPICFVAAILFAWPVFAAAEPGQAGKVNFPTHCSAAVQATMEHGLALLHSFQYEEAEQAFAKAAESDPKCALAYWGKAMALYEPLWDFPSAQTLALGRQYIAQAQKLGSEDARVRGYVQAAAVFFQSTNLKPAARVQAYSAAMQKLYSEHPEDNEAGEFYALSLIALAQMGVDDLANWKKAIAILQPIFAKYPENPGAAHYLIHAADTRDLAPEALAAARAYAKIAPDSAHALHMPSHIFRRLGMWQEMIDSNLASAAAAAKVSAEHHNGADYQLHALDFLDYAYLQSGQEAKARELDGELKKVPGATEKDIVDARSRLAARNALELHRWKEAAGLEIPNEPLELRDYTYWARAIGAARSGDVAAARAGVQKLVEIAQVVKAKELHQHDGIATGMAIDPSEAAAWLEYADGKPEQAVAILRRAAEREEAQDAEPFAMPAREMLADLYLEMKRPAEALAAYKKALQDFPNRFDALYGAARAADLSGDARAAADYYAKVISNCPADADRPELKDARRAVPAHKN
jgi:tetratricopeptide (TPR) repeat protein